MKCVCKNRGYWNLGYGSIYEYYICNEIYMVCVERNVFGSVRKFDEKVFGYNFEIIEEEEVEWEDITDEFEISIRYGKM